MKITAIRTHILTSELAQPFAFSQGWVGKRSATRSGTKSGLIGPAFVASGGRVKIPHGPGLGIETVAETLDKYRVCSLFRLRSANA